MIRTQSRPNADRGSTVCLTGVVNALIQSEPPASHTGVSELFEDDHRFLLQALTPCHCEFDRTAQRGFSPIGKRIAQLVKRIEGNLNLPLLARLAGIGILVVPRARTYAFDRILEAAELSRSRRPGGKLVLTP